MYYNIKPERSQLMKIEIFKKNESLITIQTHPTIHRELANYFSVMAANYRFAPLFKSGVWNGKIRFYNSNYELPIGLTEKIYEFARLGKYEVECHFDRFNIIDRKEFQKFVSSLELKRKEGNEIVECIFSLILVKCMY
jgi:hypothetical protein